MASYSDTKHYPSNDGTLPAVEGQLDWHAEHNPNVPWVLFPSPEDPTTVRSLSFSDFALASHRIAHVLRPGRSGADGEPIAMIFHCDTIHYNAMIAGAMRAGLVPYPMSARNTPEAVVNMLTVADCHRVIYQQSTKELLGTAQSVLQQTGHSLELLELPHIDEVFPTIHGRIGRPVDPYPAAVQKHHPDDPAIHLHSSGSSGLPKTITLTQKIVSFWMGNTFMEQNRKRNVRYALMGLPSFHTIGVVMQLLLPLANAQTWAAYEPKYPAPPVVPTPQNTLEVAKLTGCDGILAVPTFIEALAESEDAIAYLKTLKILLFGGAALSTATGHKLEKAGVRLVSCYGATEWGPYVLVFDDNHPTDPYAVMGDWEWFCFPPEVKPRFIPQGDGTFELQILTWEKHQSAVENLPDVRGYASSDLLVPHPTKSGFWRVIGRLDDVIVFSSGEKHVPVAQENFLSARPLIRGAVMFGRGRNEPGLLLEPTPEAAFDPKDERKLVEYRNAVWPYVEEANKLAPAFGRIFKEMIVVTNPDKPMGRAGKGSVQRKKVLLDYAQEIDELYESVQASKEDNGIAPPAQWDADQTKVWLLLHAAAISNSVAPHADVDLFEQGFDSLSSTFLRNRILGALQSSPQASASRGITQNFVFANPTVDKLTRAIVHLVNDLSDDASTEGDKDVNEINAMIAKYSVDIPAISTDKRHASLDNGIVVLLTGSTGSLGSHLLATLLKEPKVRKVFTLDRGPADVKTKQKAVFEDRGLPVGLLESAKLVAIEANYEEPDFGLQSEVVEELRHTLTHIIHSAWKVDFNLTLPSFESNVRLTRRLLDFSATCSHPVRFIFCSSISAVSGWDGSVDEKVPEEVLQDVRWVGGTGYARGKYVAERILSTARKQGHAVTTLRIGQITGSAGTGAWNTSDWIPIIVKSSVSLGCMPDLVGNVSWLSMDTVCRTIQEFIAPEQDDKELPALVNVVHPRPVAWHDVIVHISNGLRSEAGQPLPVIPFDEWMKKLEKVSHSSTGKDLDTIPAIKLFSFLKQIQASSTHDDKGRALRDAEGIPKYDTVKAARVSAALRDAQPLGENEIGMWLEYWRRKEFLSPKRSV